MSHGAGLVRTTCSSGSAPGDGVGAGPLGSSSSVRLLDPVYPRTQAAMLKVAQMVREARARARVPRGDRGGQGPGRGRARGRSIAPRAGSRAAPVKLEGASSGEEFGAPPGLLPRPLLRDPKFLQPLRGVGLPGTVRNHGQSSERLPSSSPAAPLRTRAGGGESRGAALRPRKPTSSSSLAAASSSLTPRWASCHRSGLARARGPRPGLPGGKRCGDPWGSCPRPCASTQGRAGPRGRWTAVVTREASAL